MNPKNKGNTFERLICEKLSLSLTNHKEERAVWRSVNSGGTATSISKKPNQLKQSFAKKHSGDIVQIIDPGIYPVLDMFFKSFVVECKHYAKIDFYPPINKNLKEFLDQSLRESEESEKAGLLIVKGNNRKILAIVESSEVAEPKAYMKLNYQGNYFDVWDLDAFLSNIVDDYGSLNE